MFEQGYFRPILFNTALPFNKLRARYATATMEDQEHHFQEIRFGKGVIDVPKKTVVQILMDEILDPFYIFQMAAIAIFIWEQYIAYAMCILFLSIVSVVQTIVETRRNNETIRGMARYICNVEVMRTHPMHGTEFV